MQPVKVKQLSVFIENKAGRVSEVTDVLGAAGVNIRGFSVSDTAEYGHRAARRGRSRQGRRGARDAGFTVKESDVIVIKLADVPGALAAALKAVSDAGVNIEYVYSLVSTYVVMNVADIDRALQLLQGAPVELVSLDDITV